MSEYLVQNKNTLLSKIIFSTRSGTLDLKVWNEWNYIDTKCVMCRFEEENFEHFMTCILYGQNELKCSFIEIFGNDHEDQYDIAKEINRRLKIREKKNLMRSACLHWLPCSRILLLSCINYTFVTVRGNKLD